MSEPRALEQVADPLRLLNIKEVAKAMGVAEKTARDLVNTGRIASVPCGGDLKVPRIAIEAYYRLLAAEAARRTLRPVRRSA